MREVPSAHGIARTVSKGGPTGDHTARFDGAQRGARNRLAKSATPPHTHLSRARSRSRTGGRRSALRRGPGYGGCGRPRVVPGVVHADQCGARCESSPRFASTVAAPSTRLTAHKGRRSRPILRPLTRPLRKARARVEKTGDPSGSFPTTDIRSSLGSRSFAGCGNCRLSGNDDRRQTAPVCADGACWTVGRIDSVPVWCGKRID
jgi:hypothetical protein